MSHQPERKHRNCLNCGVMVKGRFCQRCGQENIETKQSFGAFAKHFIYDVFHFDGKFFHTLKDLLLKPGSVALEYISGKRMHYLDPVRMYLFTSAIFFLVFFSIAKPTVSGDPQPSMILDNNQRIGIAHELLSPPQHSAAAFRNYVISMLLDTNQVIIFKRDSIRKDSLINFKGFNYRMTAFTKEEFVHLNDKSGWVSRMLTKKARRLAVKNPDQLSAGPVIVINEFLHRLPYLLFTSLPFFALILKLLYIRRRQFYYSDHVVFTLYHYIFSFFLLLIVFGFRQLADLMHTRIFVWLSVALAVYWLIFLYKGMRKFYGQNRWKTVIKFLIVNILGLVSLIFLGFVFLLISAIEF